MSENSTSVEMQNVDTAHDGQSDDDRTQEHDDNDNHEYQNMHPKAIEYVKELNREKFLLDHVEFPHAAKLIDKEIELTQSVGRAPPKENKYIDIVKNAQIKVSANVLVPVKTYPKFNFIGKILGPKGHTLKKLQEDTMCRVIIKGRGSMKNPAKEEVLRNSPEPKYAHLSDLLNVEVSALASPSEAHARMSYALSELSKYLTPDKNDDISLRQMFEMERITGQKVTSFIQTGGHYDPMAMIKKSRMSFDGSGSGRSVRNVGDFNFGRESTYNNPPADRRFGGMETNVNVNNWGVSGSESTIPSYSSSGAQKLSTVNALRYRSGPYVPYTRRPENSQK